MTDIVSFQTKRKYLTPKDLFDNATKEGQDKIVICSMKDDGSVGVWSSDMTPAELVYMVQTADYLACSGALEGHNTKTFYDGFVED